MHGKLKTTLSDGSVEALWDTLIALAMAAGISVSVISLAAHLNEARAVRSASSVSASALSVGVAGLNSAPATSTLN